MPHYIHWDKFFTQETYGYQSIHHHIEYIKVGPNTSKECVCRLFALNSYNHQRVETRNSVKKCKKRWKPSQIQSFIPVVLGSILDMVMDIDLGYPEVNTAFDAILGKHLLS